MKELTILNKILLSKLQFAPQHKILNCVVLHDTFINKFYYSVVDVLVRNYVLVS
jgi:hypothetical protein